MLDYNTNMLAAVGSHLLASKAVRADLMPGSCGAIADPNTPSTWNHAAEYLVGEGAMVGKARYLADRRSVVRT